MEVRHLDGKAEVRDLIRVHGLAWREAYEGLLPSEVLEDLTVDPTADEVRQWQEGLRENEEGVLVAVDDDGTVRGFVDMRWGDEETKAFVGEREAGLKAIHVHPDWWNQGIGTALLERGLDLLPDSIEAVRLEMFAGNDVGQRFYEAKGFERADTGTYEIDGRSYETVIYALHL